MKRLSATIGVARWAVVDRALELGRTCVLASILLAAIGSPATAQQSLSPVMAEAQIGPVPDASGLQPAVQPLAQPLAQADMPSIQDAPGQSYDDDDDDGLESDLFPDYVYSRRYYDSTTGGARAIADYGPAGYVPREIQDAPGAPEFERIAPPDRVTDDERDKFVTRGMFPGSYLVPGTNTSFRFRGFVRLTGLYDFDPIGSRDDFVTNTIPVPQEVGQNFNMSARYSRFALETWTPTDYCDWNIHTFIEGDFFNGPAQAVGGGGNPYRLRFAFVDFGYIRAGQQNTVFMDGNAWPSTVDFAGPRGLVNQRRPGLRFTLPLTEHVFWASGLEQPFSDITTNGLGTGVQDVPDLASHLRFEGVAGSHLQLSAIGRSIGYRPTGGDVTRLTGWGVSASTVLHPWAILAGTNPVTDEDPSGWARSRILLQYTYGDGIGRYLQDTAGLGQDAQVSPTTGDFDTVQASGWSASYEHWFNSRWLSNVTYTELQTDIAAVQPATTYTGASYLATSLWWIPVTRLSIGTEYVWGERTNLDGQRGRADRINALIQYNF